MLRKQGSRELTAALSNNIDELGRTFPSLGDFLTTEWLERSSRAARAEQRPRKLDVPRGS
jgi:hypothetical protein